MSRVLIVDDEKNIRMGLETALTRVGHNVVSAASIAEARSHLAADRDIDCALVDIRLKDGSGLELLREVRTATREMPIIMATAYDDGERTIEAMRDGAFDYLTKPFDLPRLLATVERAVAQRSASQTATAGGTALAENDATLVGKSAAMHAVWKTIGRAARSDAPVVVRGETGTGKDLVARAIHAYSSRAAAPLATLAVDSGTTPEALARSLASISTAGSLLIDGVDQLKPASQVRLATFLGVAGGPRVIAQLPGTPQDAVLPELYCQLAVFEIVVPPLRERRSDIALLVARALPDTRARAIAEDAMTALTAYDWPGNVRELFLVVRRAAEMCAGEVIAAHDLPRELSTTSAAQGEPANRYAGLPLREAVARLERDLLVSALRRADGNRTLAAKLLGIPRPQLYAKLEEHGLNDRRSLDS